MRRVLRGIDAISDWSGKLVSVLILFMMVVLLTEITLRYVFNAPTSWAHESSQHMFGAFSMLAGAHVLLHFQHVRVDVIYSRFSPRGRAILDSVTYLLFFLFCGLMLKYGIEYATMAVKIKEMSFSPWGPPIYPLKCAVPLAAGLILLQGVAHYIRFLHKAITGRELA